MQCVAIDILVLKLSDSVADCCIHDSSSAKNCLLHSYGVKGHVIRSTCYCLCAVPVAITEE